MCKLSQIFFHSCFALLGVTFAQAECSHDRTEYTVGGQTFCCAAGTDNSVNPPQPHGVYHSLFTQQQRTSLNATSGDLDDLDSLSASEANDLVRAFGAVDGGEQGVPTGSGRRNLNSLVRDFGDYEECPPVQP